MRLLRTLAPVPCLCAVAVTVPTPVASFVAARAEQALHATAGDDNVICRIYLDPHDKFTRVMPQRRVTQTQSAQDGSVARTGAVQSSAVLSTITVTYTGFTAQAETAFQAAVDIWKQNVASRVPIVVDAEFKDLGTPGLLGSAGSSSTRDYTGAPQPGTWFPFPLANKIAGSDIGAQFFGAGASNIAARFNSTATWSFRTDGVLVAGQVDFVSVVMHELGTIGNISGVPRVNRVNGRRPIRRWAPPGAAGDAL